MSLPDVEAVIAALDAKYPLAKSQAVLDAITLLRRMQWQPISTAPKNGTFVLLYGAVYSDVDTHKAAWEDNKYDEDSPQMMWCVANSADRDYYTRDEVTNPTHWMPLPEPPPEGA